jgi:rubredoxin
VCHLSIEKLEGVKMKKWECWPDEGIAPGTTWDDVPSDWVCPDCGVGKEDFEMVEA